MWKAFIIYIYKKTVDFLGENSFAVYIDKFSTIKHLNNFSETLSKINYILYFCTEIHI